MKHISLILTIILSFALLFSSCSTDNSNQEEKFAKIQELQEQKANTENAAESESDSNSETAEDSTTTNPDSSNSDSESQGDSENSNNADSTTTNSDSENENDDNDIYYYGWVLYETGEHLESSSTETISTYSTLFQVKAKALQEADNELWLYFEQVQVIDQGSAQTYKENPCQAGQVYTSFEETRSASDSQYFEIPEDLFTETYFGYLNTDTGEYQLNVRPQITGTKTTTNYAVLYEYYDSEDGAVLREDTPTDGSEYTCVFGEDSSTTSEYTVPQVTVGSGTNSEECDRLTLDDAYIEEPKSCEYFSETGDLIGSFYDSLDLSGVLYDTEIEWVNVEWNLKRKDCGQDCDLELEDDIFSWEEFNLEDSPLLEGEVEWLWE
ncbi:hypothetical protein CL619_02230 [archaeon]|nr:hypothetical protein [archaeon]|tara:strand:- start:1273 stop:2415 length:1143 start_codon:yes stop_codon:yes gene_type:complete